MAIHHTRIRLYHIADGPLIMPLDRRITVTIATTGFNKYGEPETMTTSIPVWATRMDGDVEDVEQEGGVRNEIRRDYRIRWRADVAAAFVSDVAVQDGALRFNALRVSEQTDQGRTRRRWLLIQGVYST